MKVKLNRRNVLYYYLGEVLFVNYFMGYVDIRVSCVNMFWYEELVVDTPRTGGFFHKT